MRELVHDSSLKKIMIFYTTSVKLVASGVGSDRSVHQTKGTSKYFDFI